MADAKRLKELEKENAELKKMLAESMLENRLAEIVEEVGEFLRPKEPEIVPALYWQVVGLEQGVALSKNGVGGGNRTPRQPFQKQTLLIQNPRKTLQISALETPTSLATDRSYAHLCTFRTHLCTRKEYQKSTSISPLTSRRWLPPGPNSLQMPNSRLLRS